MVKEHNYNYANYHSTIQEVNEPLQAKRGITKKQFELIDQAISRLHNISRESDTMDYEDFKDKTDGLMAQGNIQGAIRKAIERYGLSKVDKHFNDIRIHRDDKLNYYYYPYGLSDAKPTEPKDFEIKVGLSYYPHK